MKRSFLVLLAMVSMTLAGCTANGGATLQPLNETISVGDLGGLFGIPFEGTDLTSSGSAQLALTANVSQVGESYTFRSAGSFRNSSNGVSFTFKANSKTSLGSPAALRNVAGMIARGEPTAKCSFFGGTISNARGIGPSKDGLIIGVVIDGVVELEGRELIFLAATTGSTPYGYAGLVDKGNYQFSANGTCDFSG